MSKRKSYDKFVGELMKKARAINLFVTEGDVAWAYKLNTVITDMYSWREADEFFAKFEEEVPIFPERE